MKFSKKCSSGYFCMGPTAVFVLFLLSILAVYVYFNYYASTKTRNNDFTNKNIVVLSPNIPLADHISKNDIFNDPYIPPLKNDGFAFNSDCIPLSGRNMVRPRHQIPINIGTRETNNVYSQIGILTKNGAENSENPLILPLIGRKHLIGRDKWQYYTINNSGNLNTKLPVKYKGKNCTSEYGCDEIMNFDQVKVDGYNQGSFKATIYENENYNYIPI